MYLSFSSNRMFHPSIQILYLFEIYFQWAWPVEYSWCYSLGSCALFLISKMANTWLGIVYCEASLNEWFYRLILAKWKVKFSCSFGCHTRINNYFNNHFLRFNVHNTGMNSRLNAQFVLAQTAMASYQLWISRLCSRASLNDWRWFYNTFVYKEF